MVLLILILLGCALGAVLSGGWLEAVGILGMVVALCFWPREWRRPARWWGRQRWWSE